MNKTKGEKKMKRRILALTIIISALANVAIGRDSYAKLNPTLVTKYHKARCTDKNQSLYFVIRETDGKLDGGFMYFENLQVATLTATNAGTGVIRAKINGNTINGKTVDIGFEIHKSGGIMVANYTPGSVKRIKICTADYKYE